LITLSSPLALCGAGALTPVGLSAPAVCAAMRAGIGAFAQTSYMTVHGERLIGAAVPDVAATNLGIAYVAALAAPALAECMAALPRRGQPRVRVYFGTQSFERADRDRVTVNLTEALRAGLEKTASREPPLPFDLEIVSEGEMSFAHGLVRAADGLARGQADYAVVGGAETYLVDSRLRSLDRLGRLKTGRNSDGLIPGEGGCFVAVTRASQQPHKGERRAAVVWSLAIETEHALSGRAPNRGDAWTKVIRSAMSGADIRYSQIGFRPTNLSGERLPAVEEGIALMRCFLEPMPLPPAWYSSASVGTIGAGVGALLAAWVAAAYDKGYAMGDAALCELQSDDGQRAAFVMKAAEAA
jgi:3-oxoacyl-[acyl-carrier-protein] synthase I